MVAMSGPLNKQGRYPVSHAELSAYNAKYGELLTSLMHETGLSHEEFLTLTREYESHQLLADREERIPADAPDLSKVVAPPITPLQNNAPMIRAYLDFTDTFRAISKASSLKVGAVIVQNYCIIAEGVNGTPPGTPNICENPHTQRAYDWVIHAEENALKKIGYEADGACMFVSHSPCARCADLIADAGVKSVYYRHPHKAVKQAREILSQRGVTIERIERG